uniref:Uncharacterized protein n=1 Tax=Sphaerodactylus townsendi TaxID=933632 RepID=A0ACB8EJR4_9SAUR
MRLEVQDITLSQFSWIPAPTSISEAMDGATGGMASDSGSDDNSEAQAASRCPAGDIHEDLGEEGPQRYTKWQEEHPAGRNSIKLIPLGANWMNPGSSGLMGWGYTKTPDNGDRRGRLAGN